MLIVVVVDCLYTCLHYNFRYFYIAPFVLGIPILFSSILTAILRATANALMEDSTLWWSLSPYCTTMCVHASRFCAKDKTKCSRSSLGTSSIMSLTSLNC